MHFFPLSVSIWSNGKSRSYEPLASFGLLKLTVSLRAPWAVALVDRQLRIYFVNIGLAGSRTSKLHRVGNKMNECFLIHSCRYFDFQTKFYSLHEGKYLLSIPRVFPQATNPCLDCMMCFKNVNSNAQWHKSFSEEGCRTGGCLGGENARNQAPRLLAQTPTHARSQRSTVTHSWSA